ncbi:MAG: hypothetical protein NZ480_09380 [Bdellovibrionaceae bacterium]|nr:hypothetical protein [Pseudobdellovibrionaceae bacterium]MDW8189760.1 CFI-box-CTERM domain-containing protein [Pseudobdellovibrionaceae bacterium]
MSDSVTVTCPSCNQAVSSLRLISEPVQKKLTEQGLGEVPPELCENCYINYTSKVAHGAILLAEFKAREQKKLMMWKSRVNLLKKARALMRERAYADAAIAYEKYLKVLETVYEVKANELTPQHLKNTARTQELTVIASVYWDLLRIYDTSERYTARMEVVAKKLAEFLPFTPLLPDILKKAQNFAKVAKKSHIVNLFIDTVQEKKSRCFIATSAFNNEMAPEVRYLEQFRDHVLNVHWLGKKVVVLYYFFSPRLAEWLDQNPMLKPVIRSVLRGIIGVLKSWAILNKTNN